MLRWIGVVLTALAAEAAPAAEQMGSILLPGDHEAVLAPQPEATAHRSAGNGADGDNKLHQNTTPGDQSTTATALANLSLWGEVGETDNVVAGVFNRVGKVGAAIAIGKAATSLMPPPPWPPSSPRGPSSRHNPALNKKYPVDLTGVGVEALVERKVYNDIVAWAVWVLPTVQPPTGEKGNDIIRLKWGGADGTEECATNEAACVKLPLMAKLEAGFHWAMPLINMEQSGVSVWQVVENTYSVMTPNPSTMIAEKQHTMDYHESFTSDGTKQRVDADRDAQSAWTRAAAGSRRNERNEKLMYAAMKNMAGYGMNLGPKLVESAQDMHYLETMRDTMANKPASVAMKARAAVNKVKAAKYTVDEDAKCDNTCRFSHDWRIHGAEICDDGGSGALYTECALGTDCWDCGVRYPSRQSPVATSNICNHLEAGAGIKLLAAGVGGNNLKLFGVGRTVAAGISGAVGAAWHAVKGWVGLNKGWTGSCDAHGNKDAATDYSKCGHVEIALETNLINLRGYTQFTPHRFFGIQHGVMIATKISGDLVFYYEASQMQYVHMDPHLQNYPSTVPGFGGANAASAPVLWVGPIAGMDAPSTTDGRTDKYLDAYHRDGSDEAAYITNRDFIKNELAALAAIPIDYWLFWQDPEYVCGTSKIEAVGESFAQAIGFWQSAKDFVRDAISALNLAGAISESVVCGTDYLRPAGGELQARRGQKSHGQGSAGFELAEMAVWGHFIAESNPTKAIQTTTARFWNRI